MKVFALIAVLVASVGSSGGNAPADRYFGKLKMSALRIRYEIMQLRPRYETHKLLPEEAGASCHSRRGCVRRVGRSYPHDVGLLRRASVGAALRRSSRFECAYSRLTTPRIRSFAIPEHAVRSRRHGGVDARYPKPSRSSLGGRHARSPRIAWPSPSPAASPSPAGSLSPSPRPSATRLAPLATRAASLANGHRP